MDITADSAGRCGDETIGDVVRRWRDRMTADRGNGRHGEHTTTAQKPPPAESATTSPTPAGFPADPGQTTPTPFSPPPKLRRRPGLIALAIVLIAVGGLLAAWLTTTVGNTHPVLTMRADVPRGAVINAADLTVAMVPDDPALNTVPSGQREQVIGKYAAADLTAGSTLTPNSFTDKPFPEAGKSVVGVSLTLAQLPAQPLHPGDNVRIVTTPRTQDDPPKDDPASIVAAVVAARAQPDGTHVVVDVTVPTADAAGLAARAATGRVALILDSGQS